MTVRPYDCDDTFHWHLRYISYCMGRVKLLQDNGITPILVFDGASLPIKRQKNEERRL